MTSNADNDRPPPGHSLCPAIGRRDNRGRLRTYNSRVVRIPVDGDRDKNGSVLAIATVYYAGGVPQVYHVSQDIIIFETIGEPEMLGLASISNILTEMGRAINLPILDAERDFETKTPCVDANELDGEPTTH